MSKVNWDWTYCDFGDGILRPVKIGKGDGINFPHEYLRDAVARMNEEERRVKKWQENREGSLLTGSTTTEGKK